MIPEILYRRDVIFLIQIGAAILWVCGWIPTRVFLRGTSQRITMWILWSVLGLFPVVLVLPFTIKLVQSHGLMDSSARIQLLYLCVWSALCFKYLPRRNSIRPPQPA